MSPCLKVGLTAFAVVSNDNIDDANMMSFNLTKVSTVCRRLMCSGVEPTCDFSTISARFAFWLGRSVSSGWGCVCVDNMPTDEIIANPTPTKTRKMTVFITSEKKVAWGLVERRSLEQLTSWYIK